MSIDKNTVGKIAKLARIRINDDEKDVLAGELSKILTMIEELNAVNTDNIETMTSVVDVFLPQRDDKVTDGNMQEKILLNAPEQTAGFFVVPKVVE